MKFFLDTGNVGQIREFATLGMVDGVTTNPSLIAKEGKEFVPTLREICSIVAGPVNAEVVSTQAEGMLKEAEPLLKIAPNIVIKIPMIKEGIRAVRMLSAMGVKTNVTLCFSATQALLAAKAGASYISPFIGRLDDISTDGMDLIRDIVTIYKQYGYKTEVLVASVRHPIHVLEAGKLGADICTMPAAVMDMLFKHPLTDIGLQKFLEDWKKVPQPTIPQAVPAGMR